MARRAQSAPKQRKVALVFAGPGESTLDNTTDLLDDFLGIKDGEVPEEDVLDLQIAFPVSKATLASKGLKSVIEWTDNYELAFDAFTDMTEAPRNAVLDVVKFAESETPSKNLPKALIDWLREKQEDGYDEARLVLLWGQEGDETSEILLDLASSFDIKALDLTAGLDDISFDEEDEEEAAAPEPEPEPEPVKKDRTRSRRRSSSEDTTSESTNDDTTDDPPFEPTPPEEQTKPVEKKTRSRRASAPAKAKEPEPTPEGEETLQETIARVKAEEAEIDPTDPEIRQGTWTDFISERNGRKITLQDAMQAISDVSLFLNAQEGFQAQQGLARAMETQFWLETIGRFQGEAPKTAEEPAEAAQEAEEEPKRGRGRPRTRSASQRAVTEYYDEEDGAWVRAGRGRLPAGVKTRKVDPETGDVVE